MTDKKLSRSMEILEVVIQMITFYSAFMAVYFGALQKPVSQLWKSLIIFVFVAVKNQMLVLWRRHIPAAEKSNCLSRLSCFILRLLRRHFLWEQPMRSGFHTF